MTDVELASARTLKVLLHQQGYSEKVIAEIWKWFKFSDKNGVASY